MSARRIHVAVVFGGRSAEHEVSLTSARAVIDALQSRPERFVVVPIAVTKEGAWLRGGDALIRELRAATDYQPLPAPITGDALSVRPGAGGLVSGGIGPRVDLVFPVLHGPYGEDGSVQGLFKIAGVPHVGAGVLASATGMDKIVMKTLFRGAGLPVLDAVHFTSDQWKRHPADITAKIAAQVAYPCFVKPANMGSSIGISKVDTETGLVAAIAEATKHDRRLLVEPAAGDCREVECAVLGNDTPQASVLGEVVPGGEFYDYRAKYLEEGSELIIPARLRAATTQQVQQAAIAAFRAIDCAGMARVDFFVARESERFWINEINTIPGFTPISMYPKLWAASGLDFAALVERLVDLALERHEEERDD